MTIGKLDNKGFLVMVINEKGGVGKSNICFHLAHNFNDFMGMDFDVQGNLSERLPEKFYHIDINTSLNDISIPQDQKVLIDLGGNDDPRTHELCKAANLIVVPYSPTLESVMTTRSTLEKMKHVNTPILFVATRVDSGEEATEEFEEQINSLRDSIGNKEVHHLVIKNRPEFKKVSYLETPIMQLESGKWKYNYKALTKRLLTIGFDEKRVSQLIKSEAFEYEESLNKLINGEFQMAEGVFISLQKERLPHHRKLKSKAAKHELQNLYNKICEFV